MARRSAAQPVRPWNSLVASAEVMLAPRLAVTPNGYAHRTEGWQADAWDFFDRIGELRFGATWIANALSRVNLVAAAPPTNPGDEPTPITPDGEFTACQRRAAEIVAGIAGGTGGQGQLMFAFAVHLTIAGVAYLVVEPNLADPTSDHYESWLVLSSDEVKKSGDDWLIAAGPRSWRPLHPNAVVVRCWTQHPRRSWEPDAPTHAVLGVLREIDLLQQHIHASAQSRLAGAGILALPSEAVFPPGQGPQSTDPDIAAAAQNGTPPEDTFVDTLVEAMTVPIADRASAAAVVPLVVKVPGEYVDKIKHISFATPFDDRVLDLMNNAVRRLSLGLDIPPEILTGTSAMNHWGAWQVQETAITLHIEPKSEVVCHALTEGFLRPALEAEGHNPDEAIVWYDTTDLRTRPDRSSGAIEAYDRQELSGAALLRELGLSVDDAPDRDEKRERILLAVAKGAPTLAPAMLGEIGYLEPAVIGETEGEIANAAEDTIETGTTGEPAPGEATPSPAPTPARTMPDTMPPNRSALEAACDVLVLRALERAGSRLRSIAGKNRPGGAAAIACDDPARLHCTVRVLDHTNAATLLEGAWAHVATLAERYGADGDALTVTLNRYTAHLLETGAEHEYSRLARLLNA